MKETLDVEYNPTGGEDKTLLDGVSAVPFPDIHYMAEKGFHIFPLGNPFLPIIRIPQTPIPKLPIEMHIFPKGLNHEGRKETLIIWLGG